MFQAALFLGLIAPAQAITISPSPTLEALIQEGEKDPAALPTSEDAKTTAATGYTGEGFQGLTVKTLTPVGYQDPRGEGEVAIEENPEPPRGKTGPSRYKFVGNSPMKGLTIWSPKESEREDENNEEPEKKSLVSPWLVYGALGVGLLATIAGIFFPPLLFLGGLGLGVGAVLWYLNEEYS